MSASGEEWSERYRNAARRYLRDRHSYWVAAYSELSNSGRQRDGYHYMDDARNIFPRYNVLDAIGVEVDRLDPRALPPRDELLEWLQLAGVAAESIMTGRHEPGSIEELAEADERSEFTAFVNEMPSGAGVAAEPLPFRKTLNEAEAEHWRRRVQEEWQLDGLDFWEPLRSDVVRGRPAVVLRSDSFWGDERADGLASLALRTAMRVLGVDRLIELREYGPEFERDAATAELVYTGAEGLFFSEGLDWLVFASHEGVTTLGGTIVTQLRAGWSGLDNCLWDGQF